MLSIIYEPVPSIEPCANGQQQRWHAGGRAWRAAQAQGSSYSPLRLAQHGRCVLILLPVDGIQLLQGNVHSWVHHP